MAVAPLLRDTEAFLYARALEGARPLAELNTPRRVRHFLAQCAHETHGFTRLTENLNYRDPARLDALFSAVRDVHHARGLIAAGPQAIANTVYAGRHGNGDMRSFDGWNYRGRGFLQVTFRDNYRELGRITGMPLDVHPELLEQPDAAAMAAAGYWSWKAVNRAADADDVRGVTQLINPALAGLDERIAWCGRFREIYP
jgi:putative chitinase